MSLFWNWQDALSFRTPGFVGHPGVGTNIGDYGNSKLRMANRQNGADEPIHSRRRSEISAICLVAKTLMRLIRER
jgi:hypothetical protein